MGAKDSRPDNHRRFAGDQLRLPAARRAAERSLLQSALRFGLTSAKGLLDGQDGPLFLGSLLNEYNRIRVLWANPGGVAAYA